MARRNPGGYQPTHTGHPPDTTVGGPSWVPRPEWSHPSLGLMPAPWLSRRRLMSLGKTLRPVGTVIWGTATDR